MSKLVDQIHAILNEALQHNPEALQWTAEWCETTLAWDHAIDEGDEIDTEQTHRVFRTLLTGWPFNKFWIDNRSHLVPVLVSAISAWDFSNLPEAGKIHAYEMYSAPFAVVLWICGGYNFTLVDKYMPELRHLLIERMKEDDKEDGGKK